MAAWPSSTCLPKWVLISYLPMPRIREAIAFADSSPEPSMDELFTDTSVSPGERDVREIDVEAAAKLGEAAEPVQL